MADPWQVDVGNGVGTGSTSSSSPDTWGLGDLADTVLVTNRYKTSQRVTYTPHQVDGDTYDPRYPTIERGKKTKRFSGYKPETTSENLVTSLITQASKDPKGFIQTQRALFAAGFYGSTKAEDVRWGQWDDETEDAAAKAVSGFAKKQTGDQLAGVAVDDFASYLNKQVQASVESKQKYGSGETGLETPAERLAREQAEARQEVLDQFDAAKQELKAQAPTQIQNTWTDPDALASTVQASAQASIGRNLTDDEIRSFIGVFQREESAYNQAKYQAEATKQGVHLTDSGHIYSTNNPVNNQADVTAPDATAEAEQFVQQRMGQEAAGQSAAGYVNVLSSLIGSL